MIPSAVAVPLVDFELRFRFERTDPDTGEKYDERSIEQAVDRNSIPGDLTVVQSTEPFTWPDYFGWIEILFDGIDVGEQNRVTVDPDVLLCAGLRDFVGDLYTCGCGVSACAGIRGSVAVLHQRGRVLFVLPDPLREVDEDDVSPTSGAALRVYAVDKGLFNAEMASLARSILEMLSTMPNPDIGPGMPASPGYLRKIAKLCARISTATRCWRSTEVKPPIAKSETI